MEIITVPCLSDNYAYLVQGPDGVCLVDAPEAGPIIEALETRGWSLDTLLITHHHHDHVGGVAELRERYGCTVIGPGAEEAKLPPLDRAVGDGETFSFGGEEVHVMDVSGHTVGHVAFHLPGSRIAFTADSLMALGCGRVFEGTMAQMWESLQKFLTLDPGTTICSGHEYTQKNAEFALTIEPDNAALISRSDAVATARARGEPTVPSLLSDELATNPFLRAGDEPVRQGLGMMDAPAAEVFAEIRRRKDAF